MMNKAKSLWQRFKSLPFIGKVLIIILALTGLVFVRRFIRNIVSPGVTAADLLTAPVIANQYGIAANRVGICKEVALKCMRAIWDWSDWMLFWDAKFDEDEDAFIDALNELQTASEAAYVSVEFMKTYPNKVPSWASKKTLKTCANDYLTTSERKKINSVILNALK